MVFVAVYPRFSYFLLGRPAAQTGRGIMLEISGLYQPRDSLSTAWSTWNSIRQVAYRANAPTIIDRVLPFLRESVESLFGTWIVMAIMDRVFGRID